MPRGFLVKRTKRGAPVSYRVRTPQEDPALSVLIPLANQTLSRAGGLPESQTPSKTPLRLLCTTLPASYPDRALPLGSPAPGESALACATQSLALGSLACAVTKQANPSAKRAGVSPRETVPTTTVAVLGAFVCQLCQESYPGPLALAQHGCSRIARVEYRCHECSKAFSCPANLASHRRWHKPHGGVHIGGTKENEHPELSDPCNPLPHPGGTEGSYGCSHCPKQFRRRASLCKHLSLHIPTGPVLSKSQPLHGNFASHCASWAKKQF